MQAEQNQSYVAEIRIGYAAHLTLWKLHSFKLTPLDRTQGKKTLRLLSDTENTATVGGVGF